jgi:hypothetical protein
MCVEFRLYGCMGIRLYSDKTKSSYDEGSGVKKIVGNDQ